ncbi:hypothetical protein TRAPUB_709 [Trametes pubescens]|uniref:Uncharacterized protein n=1 Tax=Trametes pubescens TaxID=154538 RepID=A0A1M2VLD0_TRAPU|nr:hypothetical protein TRAPUB_709 [Trametes pubescens]
MLDLRGLYFADSGGDEEGEPPSHWSGINFRGVSSAVVGNLGATLDLPAGSDLYPEDEAAHMTPHDSMLREIEAEWADEVPEYCDDPFTTGMKSVQRSDVVQAAAPGSTIQVSQGLEALTDIEIYPSDTNGSQIESAV